MVDDDLLKRTLAITPECLTPEQLEALVDGKRTHPHLAGCPRCQAELTLLRTFESEVPLPDEGAAVNWISSHLERQRDIIKHPSRAHSGETASASWWARTFGLRAWRWAVPATAVAAVLVGIVLLRTPKEPELQANAGGQPAIYRSQEVELVAPVGELQEVPRNLQWQTFPGAKGYKVTIMEVDHSPLWIGDTGETSMAIPASARAKMLPGKPILWQVTAVDEHSRVLAISQTQRFISARADSYRKVPSPQ